VSACLCTYEIYTLLTITSGRARLLDWVRMRQDRSERTRAKEGRPLDGVERCTLTYVRPPNCNWLARRWELGQPG
jgi:hypothetical protein